MMTTDTVDDIMEAVRVRLVALVRDRPFRFINTRRDDAERFLASLETFAGLDEKEILALETQCGLPFPAVYRGYLRHFGRARGQLFQGSDTDPLQAANYREWAKQLLAESKSPYQLGDSVFVFQFHQGYSFLYFEAGREPDSPIYQFSEGDPKSRLIAPTFCRLLEMELARLEQENKAQLAAGGYYLRLVGDRQEISFPPAGSGKRPIDQDEQFNGRLATFSQRLRKST